VLLKRFVERHRPSIAQDRDGAPVFLAKDAWDLKFTTQHAPQVQFHRTREQV
jgi:peptide chain release factor 3